MTEWDDGETAAWISNVELTEPYALLLTEGLFEQAEAEARTIAAIPTQNRAGNAADKRSAGPVSIYEQMAEGEGFEPSDDVAAVNSFQGCRDQPLCHPSGDDLQGYRDDSRYGESPARA